MSNTSEQRPKLGAAMLKCTGINKVVLDGHRRRAILQDCSLHILSGQWIALLGPSGAGKTSLLHILGALDPDYQGDVAFLGASLPKLSDRQRATLRAEHYGFVFQGHNLQPHLTVLENILLPAWFGGPGPNSKRAQALLAELGLADHMHRQPKYLSGGEKQRVAIARALYSQPSLVFCDEPTGSLDRQTANMVGSLFHRLNQAGVTLLMVTHDLHLAKLANRHLWLQDGRLQEIEWGQLPQFGENYAS